MDTIWGILGLIFAVGFFGFNFVLWMPMIVYWMIEGTIVGKGEETEGQQGRMIFVGVVSGIICVWLMWQIMK